MAVESILIFCFVYLSLNKCLAVDETNTLKELVMITAMKSLFKVYLVSELNECGITTRIDAGN